MQLMYIIFNRGDIQIWSVGVTLYTMVVGTLPIFNSDLIAFFDDLESKEINYPSTLSPELTYPLHSIQSSRVLNTTDLLQKLLCRDPKERISIDEILVIFHYKLINAQSHPWMTVTESSEHLVSLKPIDRTSLTNDEINAALTTPGVFSK